MLKDASLVNRDSSTSRNPTRISRPGSNLPRVPSLAPTVYCAPAKIQGCLQDMDARRVGS